MPRKTRPRTDPVARFHTRYTVDPDTGCWNYIAQWGKPDAKHYPVVFIAERGKAIRASRFALELDGRPVGPNQMACHHCDNPRCVNPAHLYVGDAKTNAMDMVRRGRIAKNKRGRPKGYKHSAETKAKISASRRGPPDLAAAERRKKLLARFAAVGPRFGR
jgi:hypothetical protein